jgi:hypothetical protein
VRLQVLVQPNKDFSALFNVPRARPGHGNATLFRANIIKKGTNDLVDGFDYGSYPTDGINKQSCETKGGNMRLKWNLATSRCTRSPATKRAFLQPCRRRRRLWRRVCAAAERPGLHPFVGRNRRRAA